MFVNQASWIGPPVEEVKSSDIIKCVVVEAPTEWREVDTEDIIAFSLVEKSKVNGV